MMKKLFVQTLVFIGLFIFCISSCFTDKADNYNKARNPKMEILELNSEMFNSNELRLSEITADYKIVKLETNKDSFIGKIKKILMSENYIIVLDDMTNELLLFDHNGKFLNKIGRIGNNWGEYLSVFDMCYDEKSNILYVIDGNKKIKRYHLPSRFIDERPDTFGLRIFIVNNKIVLFHGRDLIYQNKGCLFTFYNLDLEEPVYVYNKYQDDINKDDWLGFYSVYIFKDSLSYFSTYSNDTVFRISEKDKAISRYYLSYDFDRMPFEIRRNRTKFVKSLSKAYVMDFLETSNYFFLEAIINKKYASIVINKKDNQARVVKKNEPWEYAFYRKDAFDNDIDGGSKFWPVGKINDSTIYTYCDIVTLEAFLKERNKRRNNSKMVENNKTILLKQQELNNLLKNSKPDDNPLLIIITLK